MFGKFLSSCRKLYLLSLTLFFADFFFVFFLFLYTTFSDAAHACAILTASLYIRTRIAPIWWYWVYERMRKINEGILSLQNQSIRVCEDICQTSLISLLFFFNFSPSSHPNLLSFISKETFFFSLNWHRNYITK